MTLGGACSVWSSSVLYQARAVSRSTNHLRSRSGPDGERYGCAFRGGPPAPCCSAAARRSRPLGSEARAARRWSMALRRSLARRGPSCDLDLKTQPWYRAGAAAALARASPSAHLPSGAALDEFEPRLRDFWASAARPASAGSWKWAERPSRSTRRRQRRGASLAQQGGRRRRAAELRHCRTVSSPSKVVDSLNSAEVSRRVCTAWSETVTKMTVAMVEFEPVQFIHTIDSALMSSMTSESR
mmetsp:Transcript_31119/g.92464  ORF Transcript_31119/g.92464 Transcript_31119/m.92464 type:complete len:242 (-) Transcript_31119:223-948(-)